MVVASLFGDLASQQNLQALIDNQIENLYGKSIWRQYLDVGLPQIELTFATAIGRSRIAAAASIVDPDSPAPLRSRAALEKLEGKIPTMKEKFRMEQADYRKLKALQNLPISDQAKLDALIAKLNSDVTDCAIAPDYRIDIMMLQALSTFQIDVNITNNPDGVAFGTVDLLAKPNQKRGVAKVWTDDTADGFQDIEDTVVAAAAVGRTFKEIWIDQILWFRFKKLASVKAAIAGYNNPGSNNKFLVTLDAVNEYLTSNKMPIFKILNERRNVELDGQLNTINPWKVENLTFMPEGKVGILHNAIPIDKWEPVNGINYANYDQALVSKWRDNDPWTEFTGVELNAFPALEQIDAIWILQTDVVSA